MKVCTWNLENLFTPGHGARPESVSDFEAKADSLAATITALDPDALAIQEVGDPEALQEVMDRVGGRWHLQTALPDSRASESD